MKTAPPPHGRIKAILAIFIALMVITPTFADIFGVVYTNTNGSTYDVTVYGDLPEGTEVVVREIDDPSEYERYYKAVEEKVKGKRIVEAVFLDIKLVYEGREIEPDGAVRVVVSSTSSAPILSTSTLSTSTSTLSSKASGLSTTASGVSTTASSTGSDDISVDAMTNTAGVAKTLRKAAVVEETLGDTIVGVDEEILGDEELAEEVLGEEELDGLVVFHFGAEGLDEVASVAQGDVISFSTSSFSVYAIVYTVDVTYGEKTFHYPGTGSYRLAEILSNLGIGGLIESAELERTIDVDGPENALYLETKEGEWYLSSDVAFWDTFELRVVVDGETYVITVTDAQENETTDLSRFLHADDTDPKAVVLTVNGQEVSDQQSNPTLVRDGDQFSLTLNFREINGVVQFPTDDSWMEMDWPNALTGVNFSNGDTFDMNVGTDSHGEPIMVRGNKIKVENGKLKIQWNTNDPNFNELKSSGTAHMEIKINGTVDSTKTEIKFTDEIKKYIQTDPNNSVELSKTGNYNKAEGIVNYVIRVSSNGTNQDVTVQDNIANNNNSSALTLNDDIYYTVYNKDGTIATSSTKISRNNNYSFSQNIGTLTNGQYAVVTYSANVDTTKITGNGTTEQTSNTVNVGETSTTTNMENKINWLEFNKSAGEISGSGNAKVVGWTLTANPDMLGSMGGKTITDTIGYNSREIMHYYGNGITIQVTDNNGHSETRTLNWGDVGNSGSLTKTTTNNGEETWTYTVPDSDKGHNYKYVITYQTEVDVSGKIGNTNVSNKVGIDGITQEVGKDVPPGDDKVDIDKTHGTVTEDNTDWAVTFDVPAGGLDDVYLVDYLPRKTADMIDEYKTGTLTISYGNTTIPAYTGMEANGNPQEYYILSDDSGNADTPNFRIDFFRWDSTTSKYVAGLAGTGSKRSITVSFQTNTDQLWQETYLPGSGNEYHTNSAVLHVGNQQVQDTDTIVPPYTGINKQGWREGSVTIGGIEYPLYHYKVTIYGVSDWQDVTIYDTHDNRLQFLNVINQDGTAKYWKDATKIQVFYSGNYERTAWDSNQYRRPSISDSGSVLTIKATDSNQLPMDGTNYCTNYSIEYFMVPKDIESLEQASIAEANGDSNGVIKMDNTAEWDSHTHKAEVTYQYDGVKKSYSTPYGNNRVLHFEILINPSGQMIGTEETISLTDSFTNLSVDYSSIVVTHLDDTPLTDAEKAKTSWDYHGNQGEFIIPNATPLKVTYDARVVGNGTVTFQNVATMEGFEASTTNTFTYTIEGSGGAENYKIRIYKYAAGHMETGLGNAKFRLLDANKNPMKYPNDYQDESLRGEDITFTTIAEDGPNKGYVTVMLDSSTIGYALAKDAVYYLEEIDPPSNQYEKDYIQYSFEISDHSDYDNKNGVYRYHNDDILKISNKPEEGGLILAKSISGINQNNLTSEERDLINNITFEVTGRFQHVKLDGNGDPVLDTSGHEIYEPDSGVTTRTIKYNQFTDGRYRIPPQEIIVGEKYTVHEKDAGIEGYQLACTYRIDGGAIVESFPDQDGVVFGQEEIENNQSHRVTITNRYTTHAYYFTKYEMGTVPTMESGNNTNTNEPVLLEGAEFTVFKYNTETGEYEKTEKVYTSDEYGEFGIRWIDRGYEYGTAYYVIETKAPAGYEMLPEEYNEDYTEGPLREKYYFYFSEPNENNPIVPVGIPVEFTAIDLSCTDPDNVNIENAQLEEEMTQLKVEKKWKDVKGNDISAEKVAEKHPEWVEDGIGFYVYQVSRKSTEGEAYTAAELIATASQDASLEEDQKQGHRITTEEVPDGRFSINYDLQNKMWTGFVLEDLPKERTLLGTTTYYGYYVVDDVDGYEVDYNYTQYQNYSVSNGPTYTNGYIQFFNKEEETELTIKKKWIASQDILNRINNAQFLIYREPEEGENAGSGPNGWIAMGGLKVHKTTQSGESTSTTDVVEIDKSCNWEATVGGLVAGYTYQVVEQQIAPSDLNTDKWSITFSDDNTYVGGQDKEAIVTNVYTHRGTGVEVRKQWLDEDGNTMTNVTGSPISVKVKRASVEDQSSKVSAQVAWTNTKNRWVPGNNYNGTPFEDVEMLNLPQTSVKNDSQPIIHIKMDNVDKSTVSISGTYSDTRWDGDDLYITLNQVNGDVSLAVTAKTPDDYLNPTGTIEIQNLAECLYEAPIPSDEQFTEEVHTFTLTGTDWAESWNDAPKTGNANGKSYIYFYKIDEVDPGTGYTLKTYYNNDGIQSGIIYAVNQKKPPRGDFNIKKTTTVNGVSDTAGLINGVYVFSFADSNESHSGIVKIQVANGKAINATLEDGPEGVSVEVNNGIVTVKDLTPGQYTISEDTSKNPRGVSLVGENEINITVSENPSTVPTATFVNNKYEGSISVTKKVKVDNADSDELDGKTIKIGLFKSEDEPEDDASPTKMQNMILSGSSTTATLFTGLEFGTYWVYELDDNRHPLKTGSSITINGKSYTVSEDTASIELSTTLTTGSVEISNERGGNGSLKLTKAVTVNGTTTLSGKENLVNGNYTFEVQGPSGSNYIQYVKINVTGGQPSSYQIASSEGGLNDAVIKNSSIALLENLPIGNYTIKETDSGSLSLVKVMMNQEEITGNNGSYTIPVSAGSTGENTIVITATNNINTCTLQVVKVDKDKRTIKLKDAKLELQKYDNNEYKPFIKANFDDSIFDTLEDVQKTTNDNGELTFEYLTDGDYQLVELKAPLGYVIEEASKEIRFNVSSATLSGSNTQLVTYTPATSTITIGNEPGAALPATGGPGTKIFYSIGALLISSAALMLLRRRARL